MNLTEKLQGQRLELGYYKKEPCTDEENEMYKDMSDRYVALPYYITRVGEYKYIKTVESDIPKEKYLDLLAEKQSLDISTIKRCAVFFVVLAVIGLILGIIVSVVSLSNSSDNSRRSSSYYSQAVIDRKV